MRKLIVLVGVVLLLALALTVDSTSAGTGAAITVESAEATFGGTLLEPAITTAPSAAVAGQGRALRHLWRE